MMNSTTLRAASLALIQLLSTLIATQAFNPLPPPTIHPIRPHLHTHTPKSIISTPPTTTTRLASTSQEDTSILDTLTTGYQTFQTARSQGYNFKQSVAIAIAGQYDERAVQSKIQSHIDSAPCVLFTWEASPACKSAIRYLDVAGAKYKVVRLDDPWSEGNPMRAELGKRVGRSSVPCIFIGGEYVGGFDAGVDKESPGILEMAFRGTLRERLAEAGAL
ncbi:hypothetical protein HJC23_009574 [Cyclotella cryptica]|uniref:Glutaredoxin domain-containing protein n=1 Tax=Cyclotella cryptica TaxID=29204 RepID=A0ABD3PQD4_9STRA|eukprot:CCRYP_012525-RB/>CCRYP_012525-RB protein AED:0.03 eAED:0.03 QI:100/-1/1/1/-1/1/1/112/218